ncbi:MAG: alpha-galactosidase, partial [Bullifex sp.]
PNADVPDAECLEITLTEELSGAELILTYAAKGSSLVRGMRIKAHDRKITVRKALYSMDTLSSDHDVIWFDGRHCSERNIKRAHIDTAALTFSSRRGATSHQMNNSFIVCGTDTTETHGEAVLLSLLWSGSFTFFAEKDQYDSARCALGAGSEFFSYDLENSELVLPQLLLTYSSDGLGDLSVKNSRFVTDHIRRKLSGGLKNPVLLNNWEATYFDFDGEKLLSIAKEAKALGCDLFVLDDGWFGHRNDDTSSLGDWYENREKLGMSLDELSGKITGEGIAFGLWVEPEMVSEDSDLYRAHPDWALAVPGKSPVRGRYQLVLDMSNNEVTDYLKKVLDDLITRGRLSYMKWDYNRFITDFHSSVTAPGRIEYDYIKGLYSVFEYLNEKHPELLIEGCSGGGGRFDLGMLYYTPQSWLSDDTDAIERIDIEFGSSYIYPVSSFGSHVSAVPNHQTHRMTPLFTRSSVAMIGSYGLELDPTKLSEDEKAVIRKEINEYKELCTIIKDGDFYRLMHTPEAGCCLAVSQDKKDAVLIAVRRLSHGNPKDFHVRLRGLDANAMYSVGDKVFTGSLLMNAGLLLPFACSEDLEAVRIRIKAL